MDATFDTFTIWPNRLPLLFDPGLILELGKNPGLGLVGAPGGWLTLPLTEWNGTPLRYPIGVSDFPELIGKQFDLAAYVRIPQYMFAEDRDDRDAVRGHTTTPSSTSETNTMPRMPA